MQQSVVGNINAELLREHNKRNGPLILGLLPPEQYPIERPTRDEESIKLQGLNTNLRLRTGWDKRILYIESNLLEFVRDPLSSVLVL